MAETGRPAFLDRPAARGIAALVLMLCLGLLAYLHRDDLRLAMGGGGAPGDGTASIDPAAPCIEQRFADIDGMVEDGVIGEGQAASFKQRAEAMCRATDGGAPPPTLPLQ